MLPTSENTENTGTPRKKCAIKKGFFVLKACGDTAIGRCKACKKPVCEQHSKIYQSVQNTETDPNADNDTEKRLCIECFTRVMQAEKPALDREIHEWETGRTTNYSLWYHYARDDYYHQNNYTPFDEYDEASFDGGESGGGGAEGYWDEESGKAGFFDS
ncbi:MAG: hypothetical protein EAZ55_12465 [Cytophagales bacterium]|nr:MAG: hypothetical protein EAZ55_12465 [Cytophagales bacterium]